MSSLKERFKSTERGGGGNRPYAEVLTREQYDCPKCGYKYPIQTDIDKQIMVKAKMCLYCRDQEK